jgi:hypothetical protein
VSADAPSQRNADAAKPFAPKAREIPIQVAKLIQASDTAINLIYFDDDFKPYYNLGLVHFERENWPGAVYAFRYIVNKSLDPYPWYDRSDISL